MSCARCVLLVIFFFSSRRRHTRFKCDWSSDVCSSDLAASRIAPAIISGNTMVVKPSEQSPLSASILGEICKAILPPGVVNIVTGARETGEALVRHPRVKRIAFIGQPASGMAIQKTAAETAVRHVTLELGGKNPLIAFEDSDLDKVAACAVGGMNFGWQGQSCGSMSRILLQESIHDR